MFIHRSNRRDTLALHAKLDELLRVDSGARSELTRLDEQEPEAIKKHRDIKVQRISESRETTGRRKKRYHTSALRIAAGIERFVLRQTRS